MYCSKCGKILFKDEMKCWKCGYPRGVEYVPEQTAEPEPVVEIKPQIRYAGFGKRVGAFLMDLIILGAGGYTALLVLMGMITGVISIGGGSLHLNTIQSYFGGFGMIFGFVVAWFYFAKFESSPKQATPGKMMMGLVVTTENGVRLSTGLASKRFWGKLISIALVMIGLLMAGFTAKKQALHDLMVKTVVVEKN